MRKESSNQKNLYHYTDFAAQDGILSNSELRLNNILNMNDVIDGYRYMMELGYDEAAQICLTHSFLTFFFDFSLIVHLFNSNFRNKKHQNRSKPDSANKTGFRQQKTREAA